MRSAVGIFGLLCGLIVIGLVGRYGYTSTDVETDAWIVAFLFGAIAVGGLFGHAVAVRLWRRSKLASIAFGLVSAVALVLNLSNSLGAIAGRADHATMERVTTNRAIRAAEAEVKRLTDLRDAMPPFVPTNAAAVAAAKRVADAATTAKERECDGGNPRQRGDHCRAREGDERNAIERLANVTAAMAATDRAVKLEADAKAQRDKLAALGPIVTVNVQGSAITKLFRLPDGEAEFAATVQQFGIAVIVEMIIVMCMIAWELLGSAQGTASEVMREMNIVAPVKPRLVATTNVEPVGSVPKIMATVLEPADGERVELADAYRAYVARCKAERRRALPPEQFAESLKKFCEECGISIQRPSGRVYLVGVRCRGSKLERVQTASKRAS